MYSEQPNSFEQLIRRCEDTVDHRSIHLVEDAVTYARWILRDGVQMLDNLTATQKRCTELLEEVRTLRAQLQK